MIHAFSLWQIGRNTTDVHVLYTMDGSGKLQCSAYKFVICWCTNLCTALLVILVNTDDKLRGPIMYTNLHSTCNTGKYQWLDYKLVFGWIRKIQYINQTMYNFKLLTVMPSTSNGFTTSYCVWKDQENFSI